MPETPQEPPKLVAPVIVTGRTPYDALSELFGLLGRALPYVTVVALFLYATIEIGKSYNAAQTAAATEFAQRVESLNKLLQTNFSELEKLRTNQLDGLDKFTKLSATVMDSVVKNQQMLAKARDEAATAREQQENAAFQERSAKRELEAAQAKQHDLEREIEAKQQKIWDAEGLIDSATRLTRFIGERNTLDTRPVSLARYALSRRFENSSVDAIVRDSNGKLFYGPYRIRSDQIGAFLAYLPGVLPTLAQRLEQAGGAQAALNGDQNFRYEWMSMSRDADFIAAQDDFIDTSNYQPFVANVKGKLKPPKPGAAAFDPNMRSKALQAVMWSVAVQHGQRSDLVVRAFDGIDLGAATDDRLIAAIYKEQREIERYWPKESDAIKAMLSARYVLEEELALKMYQQERGSR